MSRIAKTAALLGVLVFGARARAEDAAMQHFAYGALDVTAAKHGSVEANDAAMLCAAAPRCAGACTQTLRWIAQQGLTRGVDATARVPMPAPCHDAAKVGSFEQLQSWAIGRFTAHLDHARQAAKGATRDVLACVKERIDRAAKHEAAPVVASEVCDRIEPLVAARAVHQLAEPDLGASVSQMLLLKRCAGLPECARTCAEEYVQLSLGSAEKIKSACAVALRDGETAKAWTARATPVLVAQTRTYYEGLAARLPRVDQARYRCDLGALFDHARAKGCAPWKE